MEFPIIKQFFLVAINPQKAKYIVLGNHLKFGVLGAALMDLYNSEAVQIENKRIILKETESTYPEFLEQPVKLLSNKFNLRLYSYFNRLGYKEYSIQKLILKYLSDQKHIKLVRKRFLGIAYIRYVPYNNDERTALIKHLRDILLRGAKPGEDDYPILYLIKSCSMVRALSNIRQERVYIRRKLRSVISDFEDRQPNSGLQMINKAMLNVIRSANARKAS